MPLFALFRFFTEPLVQPSDGPGVEPDPAVDPVPGVGCFDSFAVALKGGDDADHLLRKDAAASRSRGN